MQPQGHVQVLRNMIDLGLNPQEALDRPRWCIDDITHAPDSLRVSSIALEDGYTVLPEVGSSEENSEDVTKRDIFENLTSRGHVARWVRGWDRWLFGRGQIITCNSSASNQVLSAGSDPRADGCAIPSI